MLKREEERQKKRREEEINQRNIPDERNEMKIEKRKCEEK